VLRKLLILCVLLGGCYTRAMVIPVVVPAGNIHHYAVNNFLRQRPGLASLVYGLSAIGCGYAAKYCWKKANYWHNQLEEANKHDYGKLYRDHAADSAEFWPKMFGTLVVATGFLCLASLVCAAKVCTLKNKMMKV